MKRACAILVFLGIACVLLSQAGCKEAARPVQEPQRVVPVPDKPVAVTEKAPAPRKPKPAPDRTRPAPDKPKPVRDRTRPALSKPKPDPSAPAPKIRVDKVVHDFGEISPGSSSVCEFVITNAGDGLLKIIRVVPDCSRCTILELTKRRYAPGEQGTLKTRYHATSRLGPTRSSIVVKSNDKAKPDLTLTIRAKIVARVGFEPKRLNLLLKDEPIGKITLTSLDGKPFSIKGIMSTVNAITADFDSSVEATKFVLQPRVDTAKLRRVSSGVIEVQLTHPECKKVSIPFSALVRFKVNPPVIIAFNAEPGKKIKRNIWVLNNYGEQFEVASAKSRQGIVKVLSQEKIGSGYKFVVEITPPERGGKMNFTDEFLVQVKGGELLKTTCQGFYSRKRPTTR